MELKRAREKFKEIEELKKITEDLKMQGKRIVFTNGCFDLIHIGHLSLLEQAKSFGEVLIVGLNSDYSIKKIKGESRPIVPENERVQVISSIEDVDYVVLFSEENPCEIIQQLKPHFHVKGGDYNPEDFSNMPEAKIIKEYGGKIKIIKILEGRSTTNLINSLKF